MLVVSEFELMMMKYVMVLIICLVGELVLYVYWVDVELEFVVLLLLFMVIFRKESVFKKKEVRRSY